MNEGEFIEVIRKTHRLPKRLSKEIFKTILRTIAVELKAGRRVHLRNFGMFEMRKSHGKRRPKFNASPNLLQQTKKPRRPGKKKR